jgi:glycosyltransferase involved in cell wall biosynthesis
MAHSKRKHICLNLIADPNWHAGNIYIFNIIHALSLLPENERQQLKVSIATRNVNDIPDEVLGKVDQIYHESTLHLVFYKILRVLPSFLRLGIFNYRKIDFYYPGGNLPRKWIFNWGGWIPDFQYRHLPHLFSKEEYSSRENRNRYLAHNAPILAFSSKHAMNDYFTFFPECKGNEYLLRFVSSANEVWLKENPIEIQHKYNLPDSFFIVCNQFWKHKDHQTVIRCIALLKKRGVHIHVVCTGATEDFRNPEYYPSLLALAKELEVSQHFIVLGFISRKDQIQLIRRSVAIIQPSLFEGWSTVVEDGRSLGKSIFLSDFPVHLEQNPPYVLFFKQQNENELANLIEQNLIQLSAGPDYERERKAFEENQTMMLDFGRHIVAMCNFQKH